MPRKSPDEQVVRDALRAYLRLARQHRRGGTEHHHERAKQALAAFERIIHPTLFDLPDEDSG